MASKTREKLYELFATGNKPSEDDYADLIDSMINIAEDGIGISEKGEPMELIQQGTKERFLDLSSSQDNPVWRINALSSSGISGLNVATADSKSRVYVKKENGFLGINNDAPEAQLHITGDSGDLFKVESGTSQTALVVDTDGKLGIGTADLAEGYQVTVDGKVKQQGDIYITGGAYAQNGLTVEGAELSAAQGLSVQNGVVIESGLLQAKAGATITGAAFNANAGAIVSGAMLEAQDGLTVEGAELSATQGLNVQNGAVIESGLLEAKAGATVSGAAFNASAGAIVSGASLQAQNGLSVTGGAVIGSGTLVAKAGGVFSGATLTVEDGLTVDQGAVITGGELKAQAGAIVSGGSLTVEDGLTVTNGAVITCELKAQQGLTVNQGVVVATGTLEAQAGLTVKGATTLTNETVIENGLLTAKSGLTVANASTFTAEGAVTLGNADSGTVTSKGLFTAAQGIKIENAELEATAGATISGAELQVEQGLIVQNSATVESGTLTAKGGLSVPADATLSAVGAVTLGNATDGAVTVDGGLTANKGATIRGGELIADAGLSVTGKLSASDSAELGTVTVSTLTVTDINVSGNLGLDTIDISSLTADTAEIGNLTVNSDLSVAGMCQLADSAVFNTGMLYVSYEGTEDVHPVLKVVQGTVTGDTGHFDITVDDAKQLTIVYNDASEFLYLPDDWETYQTDQPTLTTGFNLIRVGDTTWDLEDCEMSLNATGTYREYINSDTGLRVIYTATTDNTPQLTITANTDTSVTEFKFTIAAQNLTIQYPADQEYGTLTRMLSDWDTWISENYESSGNFELRKTSDATGEAVIAALASTALEVNADGNVFNKALIKTNMVTVKGHFKLGDSDLEIGGFSDSETLSENSDAYLPTQKAVKTYVDTGLALKADTATMEAALEDKVDSTTFKTDMATMEAALEDKVDSTTFKTDMATMEDALEGKVDSTTFKTDMATMKAALGDKVDTTTLTTALAAKAGLIKISDLKVAVGEIASDESITLTDDSRGLLLLKLTTAAGSVSAGLFALFGTGSLIKITGDGLTDQQDSSSACNVYLTDGVITLQNTLTDAVTVTLTCFGI